MPVSFGPGQAVHIYRILRKLGEGGMGAVYEAVQDPIGRRVALKILHAQYASDPAVMSRFFNEARAVNIIAHPGLVQVSDFGRTADGTAYLVMELLSGENLAERLRHRRRLPVDDALQILQQLSSALAAAHQYGIVHRDLKPSNVMLTPNPAMTSGEQVKIVDFGIAKLLDENAHQQGGGLKTDTGKILGTPQYMAPEQAKTTKVDGRADVYAVGAMAYEMLSGRMPYPMKPDELVWALLARKLTEAPPDLARLDPSLPKELAQLVMTLLAKEPADRPAMAQLDSVLCRLRGIDPTKRSGMHVTVASAEPVSESSLVTMDAPVAVPLTLSAAPTVAELPGAPPPNLLSPPRPVSSAAPYHGDGAVAEEMPSISTVPVRAQAQVSTVAPPAPAVPSPALATTPPALRNAWLIGIMAVVIAEAVTVAVYMTTSRPDKHIQGQQGRLIVPRDLASPPDLAAPADLAPPSDLALRVARPTDAKSKDPAHLRASHPPRQAAMTVTEACIHGKNLSPALRRQILAALGDSKLRLGPGDRLIVGIGEYGVRIVDAPNRLAQTLLNDFRLILGRSLDANPRFGEIDILCSAPVR